MFQEEGLKQSDGCDVICHRLRLVLSSTDEDGTIENTGKVSPVESVFLDAEFKAAAEVSYFELFNRCDDCTSPILVFILG